MCVVQAIRAYTFECSSLESSVDEFELKTRLEILKEKAKYVLFNNGFHEFALLVSR